MHCVDRLLDLPMSLFDAGVIFLGGTNPGEGSVSGFQVLIGDIEFDAKNGMTHALRLLSAFGRNVWIPPHTSQSFLVARTFEVGFT